MKDDRLSPVPRRACRPRYGRAGPDTPQTRSSAYRLAFADEEFPVPRRAAPGAAAARTAQARDDPDDEYGIDSTVVLFGGARIPEPARKDEARTETLAELSRFYDEARAFAR
jgi:hypothetical protein